VICNISDWNARGNRASPVLKAASSRKSAWREGSHVLPVYKADFGVVQAIQNQSNAAPTILLSEKMDSKAFVYEHVAGPDLSQKKSFRSEIQEPYQVPRKKAFTP
jgi:hypothetical protein